MYKFAQFLDNTDDVLFEEFLDKHVACVSSYEEEKHATVSSYYKKIIELLCTTSSGFEELISMYEALTKYKMSIDIPYVIVTNELYALKNMLISKLAESNAQIVEILTLFESINNVVAKIYLHSYIEKLTSQNNIRISSLSDLLEKNIISHYESHLVWLTKLASLIKNEQREDFVELDHTMCDFGQWLHENAKNTIQNNSKHKSIDNLHQSLHLFATKIYNTLDNTQYHIIITYLEKCELISLSIGTELALVDNILMNKRITKDTLTGALNRQALRNVFESQYELSLATNSSFVLAMCDLDYFKNINDTYGHIAGDKLLKSFVDIVKQKVRNSDVIVRYGGEEFIIMLPAIDKEKGKSVLNLVLKAFEQSSIDFNGNTISATVSIGMLAITPEKEYKKAFVDEYIMIADQQLYLAKEGGRNKVEAY